MADAAVGRLRGVHLACERPGAAVTSRVQDLLKAAAVTLAYRAALAAALALPGNILSETPDARWARLVWTCCVAAGGGYDQAMPIAAVAEIFMVSLDILDDIEDEEETLLHAQLGSACLLNVSTGLLLLAQQSLLDLTHGVRATQILLHAGLTACNGQHTDLAGLSGSLDILDETLAVTAGKSASLVAALCQLGAFAAGAGAPVQERYAHFGGYLGMMLQLTNDIAALQPNALEKTDIALGRPTLPLTYAAVLPRSQPEDDGEPAARAAMWAQGPVQVTWVVAETYRRRAAALIPQLTADQGSRTALASLLHGR